MDMHAYLNRDCVTVTEPVAADVRFSVVERDGQRFADLNESDLAALYEKLPQGASPTERGQIECYLCEIAEEEIRRDEAIAEFADVADEVRDLPE